LSRELDVVVDEDHVRGLGDHLRLRAEPPVPADRLVQVGEDRLLPWRNLVRRERKRDQGEQSELPHRSSGAETWARWPRRTRVQAGAPDAEMPRRPARRPVAAAVLNEPRLEHIERRD